MEGAFRCLRRRLPVRARQIPARRADPLPADTAGRPGPPNAPVNLEARVADIYELEKDDSGTGAGAVAVEVTITCVHVHPAPACTCIPASGSPAPRTASTPDAWRPLIMSFQHFYGPGDRLHPSRLAAIDEERYR